MSTVAQQYSLAQNGNFQYRVIAAATAYGVGTVYGEVNTTNDYANRRKLLFQVVLYPSTWAARFALACVMANANLQTAAPNDSSALDADIQTAVQTVWNGLADALADLQTSKVI